MIAQGKASREERTQTYFCSNQLGEEMMANETKRILDAEYRTSNIKEVAANCLNLSQQQRKELTMSLRKFAKLFSGKLGKYLHKSFSIQLQNPDTEPIFCPPFSIPRIHVPTFKRELQHLVEEQVLKRIERSEWAFLTFIIPKKDGRVRWVSDFRKLNQVIKRKRYFLPNINEVMQRRNGFKFITKIDLSMGFYTFQLDEVAQNYCVISTPFGLYKYLRLPMGLSISPDIFQSVMHPLFQDLEEVECFIDDIGVFTNGNFMEHLKVVERVLERLEGSEFTVNAAKCEWACEETDYLGFLITRDGIKPMAKKVKAILDIDRPRSTKDVRSFVGLVNYYKDMWPQRAHTLAPLTQLCSNKIKFNWEEIHEIAFQKMKRIVAKDVMLRFPQHDKKFVIHTDASQHQIGATISQENKPIAYFSRKLSATQRRYATIEQEMLAIVKVLKEYRNFLLGANITIYTDHKNLLANNSDNNSVFRWKQKIQEYGPTLIYVKGKDNIAANALSRLPMTIVIKRQWRLCLIILLTTLMILSLTDTHWIYN